ncbi:hypothetical protein KVH30_34085 [Streptomyces olivaceus]|uniref:hypothetical protein n=1 Tax=Streptomyces olivaceus TaxID=47716 RepID=UPI001CC9A58C|nr:hypothetical protein [Streptomyces olivaceus]MBZ6295471.1 hypothetical protein [Streptomyces olivaceus]MBZ6330507.1 hypothetical protein [Streptomyces olivaceus]
MPDELRVVVPGSDGLLGPTKDALETSVTKYGRELLREAQRLESRNRANTGPAQVTVRDVRDAEIIKSRNLTPPKKDMVAQCLWVTASVSGIATGWFGNQTQETWGVIGLFVCGLIMVVSGLLGYLK